MPHHSEERFMPYAPDDLYDLVADVAKYPEFLPWCVGARITRQTEEGFHADLIIGFKMFKERFTSHVKLSPKTAIDVDYVKGPLRRLRNAWRFKPAQGGTLIAFDVDFEFNNILLERLIGTLFEESLFRMISAFETRAQEKLIPIAPESS